MEVQKNSRLQLFQNLDMFGVPICIRFNSNETHKTGFGATITLAIIILLTIQLGEVLNDIFSFANFSIIFQENIVAVPSRFEIKPQNFSFAFGLQDAKLSQILDESIYTVEAIYRDTYKVFNPATNQFDFKTDEYPFKAVPCTADHFQVSGVTEYFLKLPFKKLYCLPTDQLLILQGQFGSDIYRRIRIKIKVCQGSHCKPMDQIQSAIGYCNLQIYYINYAVQVIDRQNPFKGIGQNTFWQSGYSIMKNINIYFRNTYVDSDEGYISSNLKTHQNLLYSFDREQLVTQVDNIMFDVYINLEKNKESQYIRRYKKLQEGLSQLGGLFNFLFSLGSIICYPLSRLLLSQKLLNSVFSFQEKDSQLLTLAASQQKEYQQNLFQLNDSSSKSNPHLKQQFYQKSQQQNQIRLENNILNSKLVSNSDVFGLKQSQLKNTRNKNRSKLKKDEVLFTREEQPVESNNTESKQLNQDNYKIETNIPSPYLYPSQYPIIEAGKEDQVIENKSQIKSSLSQLQIKLCDIIRGIFSQKLFMFIRNKQSEKSEMINYAFEKLNNQLDIYRIIIKLQELDKLKHLLLNDDQIKLLEYIPQPVLNLNKFKQLTQNKEKSKFGIFHNDIKNPLERAQDALSAYHNIFKLKDKESISKIDKKLLQLIDPYQMNDKQDLLQHFSSSKYNDTNQLTLQADSRLRKLSNTEFTEEIQFGHIKNTNCNKDSEVLGENLIFLDK